MTKTATMARQTLDHYLALSYPFQVIADPESGYLVRFPDLPGCFTQVDEVDDIGPMAEEIRTLWIETEYERGHDIPLPTYPEEYSGKFNVRLPRSLHRRLAEAAERDGVSLNQFVVMLLSGGIVSRSDRTDDRPSVDQHRREKVTA
jgi:predicted RNase H-like HicB family nuclease